MRNIVNKNPYSSFKSSTNVRIHHWTIVVLIVFVPTQKPRTPVLAIMVSLEMDSLAQVWSDFHVSKKNFYFILENGEFHNVAYSRQPGHFSNSKLNVEHDARIYFAQKTQVMPWF